MGRVIVLPLKTRAEAKEDDGKLRCTGCRRVLGDLQALAEHLVLTVDCRCGSGASLVLDCRDTDPVA